MDISQRVLNIPVSSVRKLVPYAKKAQAEGVSILHLNIGDPDIPTPKELIEVLHTWSDNPIRYTPSTGLPQFLQIMQKYYESCGYPNITVENILATVGGSEAITMVLLSVAEAGEEVLVFEPFYSNYSSCAAIADINLIAIPTNFKDGFHLPPRNEIIKHISHKTKAILFCNPGNPTGTVYSKEEIEMLVSIAKEYGLFLVSDEVYREYVFDNRMHVSLIPFMDEIPDQAIQMDSLSKRYSLCGARLGIVVSKNPEVIKACNLIAQSRLSGGYIDQIVGSHILDVPDSYLESVKQEYENRRNILYTGLQSIPGIELSIPEGAFYCMVKLPVENAMKFAQWLLEEFRLDNTTVMLAPGEGFYATPGVGTQEVRIAYVLNTEKLKQAIEIIKEGLSEYTKK